MTETLTLPRLGETMESGRVANWLKRPGDSFRRGETIVEIESDKTVVELPALADGTLVEIVAGEGTEVDVGAPLCTYDGVGAPPQTPPGVAALDPPRDRTRATPLARRLARENGVAIESLNGTGRRGRVDARDVRAEPLAATARGTICLVHGFGGDAQTWASLATPLGRSGWLVRATDLPDADAIDELVRHTLDFVASCGPDLELVGHSMGAVVALAVARALPGTVRRLTLVAPAGLGSEIDADFIDGLAAGGSEATLAHLLRRLAVRPAALSASRLDEMARSLGSGRLRSLAARLVVNGRQAVDIVEDLRSCPVATRIVWGLEDRIIPWRHALNAPSRTALHLVPGVGHMPHWDQPGEIAALFD